MEKLTDNELKGRHQTVLAEKWTEREEAGSTVHNWNQLRLHITDAAREVVGVYFKTKKNEFFYEECAAAIAEC